MRAPQIFGCIVGASALAFALAVQAAPAANAHEMILRRLISDAAQGQIQYESMTPDLAQAVRPQAAIAQSELTALGALRSVTFKSVNSIGQELYRTDFEHGALEWAFSVNHEGLIDTARYRPVVAAAR